MPFVRSLSKHVLIKRLQFALDKYPVDMLEFDLRMIFDDELWTLWENGHFINQRFPEIEAKFDSKYVIRKSMINKIRRLNKKFINELELEKLFEEGNDLILGPFLPSGDKNDIFSFLTACYFNSYGTGVFRFDKKSRTVPNKLSNDPLFEKANANYLYNAIKSGRIKAEQIKILKLANGAKVEAHKVFLDEIKKLDKENGIDVYSKLQYIITDFTSKIIDDVKKKCLKIKELKKAYKLGLLDFKVFDVLSPIEEYSKDLAVIDASYLFDSISSPIIIKRNNDLYHVYIRGVICDKYKVHYTNGRKISHKDFKSLLLRKDYKRLSKIEKRAFNLVRIETKLVKTDINKLPYSKQLKEFLKIPEIEIFSLNLPLIDFLEKCKKILVHGGYFQSFDYGIVDSKKLKFRPRIYQRYTGNITFPLNYAFLQILENGDYKINIENSLNYLNKFSNDEVIYFSNLRDKMTNFEAFSKLFDFSYLKNLAKLKESNEKLLKMYGYSQEGLRKFNEFLVKNKLLEWKDRKWVDSHNSKKDYLFDYLNSLFLYFKFNVMDKYKQLWLFEYPNQNPEFVKLLNKFGYDEGVIRHIFKHYNEFEEISYIRMEFTNT